MKLKGEDDLNNYGVINYCSRNEFKGFKLIQIKEC